jgi:hypothetical protein
MNYDLEFVQQCIYKHIESGKNPIRDYCDDDFRNFEFEFAQVFIKRLSEYCVNIELSYLNSKRYRLGKFLLSPFNFIMK